MEVGGEEEDARSAQQARTESSQPQRAEDTPDASNTHARQGAAINNARGASAPPTFLAPSLPDSAQLRSAFAARALAPASRSPSSSTATTGSSFEGSLRQPGRLPPLPEQQQQQDSDTPVGSDGGSRSPEQPVTCLPPPALLHGANSISNASPFMQQQMSEINSEGSSRWRSGWLAAATAAQAAKLPPPAAGLGAPFANVAAESSVKSKAERQAAVLGEEEKEAAVDASTARQAKSDVSVTPPAPALRPCTQHAPHRAAGPFTQHHRHPLRHNQSPHLRPLALTTSHAAYAPPASAVPLAAHPRSPQSPQRRQVLAHAAQLQAQGVSGTAALMPAAPLPATTPATPRPAQAPPPHTQQLQFTPAPPSPQQQQHVVGSFQATPSPLYPLQLPQPPPSEPLVAAQPALAAAAAGLPAFMQSAGLAAPPMPAGPSLQGLPVQPGQALQGMLMLQQQQALHQQATAALHQQQHQAAALAACQPQHQQAAALPACQPQQGPVALALPALHPAAAAFAGASPAAQAAMVAALNQQQGQHEQQAAAVAAEQQHLQQQALALAQQQETALLVARQQQALVQGLLQAHNPVSTSAVVLDAGSQQVTGPGQAQQGVQLTAAQLQQQQRQLQGQHVAAAAAAVQPAVQYQQYQQYQQPFMQHQPLAPAGLPAVPLPLPSALCPPWLLSPPVPGTLQPHFLQTGILPTTPDQLPEQQGYDARERQPSQALSGYNEFASGSSALPQCQLPQFLPPGREAVLQYSSPAASRSMIEAMRGQAPAGTGDAATGAQQQQATAAAAASQSALAAAAAAAVVSRSLKAGPPQQRIKAVVATGGRFVRPSLNRSGAASGGNGGSGGGVSSGKAAQHGSWRYEGGKTLLVSLPVSCSLAELLVLLSEKQRRTPGGGNPAAAAVEGPVQPSTASPSTSSQQWSMGFGKSLATTTSALDSCGGEGAMLPTAAAAPAMQQQLGSVPETGAEAPTSELAGAAAAVEDAGPGTAGGLQKMCIVRYQLPSEPNLLVDVLDDEDVRLMFEEYAECAAEGATASGSPSAARARKLLIFVQWLSPDEQQPSQESAEAADSALAPPAASPGKLTPTDSSAEDARTEPASTAAAADWPQPRLSDLRSNKIEVLHAADVTLTALLGTGTFGVTYRGRWHESDVAVKTIAPLMIGVQYASRQAWVDFLRDANAMGKLRHPNLAEVYGVVLPHDSDPRLAAPRSLSEPVAAAAAAATEAALVQEELALEQEPAAEGLPPSLPPPAAAAEPTSPGAAAPPLPELPQAAATTLRHPAQAPLPSSPDDVDFSSCPPPPPADSLVLRQATLPAVAEAVLPQELPAAVANPPAIVMELVSGRSLGAAIDGHSDLLGSRLARVVYALDTAKALSYLHSRKVAHLDLKSGNVLLGWRDRRPTAKVVGYGLSGRKVSMVRAAAQGVATSPSMFPWVAPEVLRTPELVTGKADVFSFGVVLWELWALKKPYEQQDTLALLSRVMEGEIVRPPVPEGTEPPGPGWQELLERCWAEDPEQRPDFSVIEEELRSIAREVKRQQAPRRPPAPLPRAASRQALSMQRQPSGTWAVRRQMSTAAGAAAARRQGSSASATAVSAPSAAVPARQQPNGGEAAGGTGNAAAAAQAPARLASSSSFRLASGGATTAPAAGEAHPAAPA